MTNDDVRLSLAKRLGPTAREQARARGGPLEETVVVVADTADPNAAAFLRSQNLDVEDEPFGMLVMGRREVISAFMPFDQDLAAALETAVPSKLQMVVIAATGWSVVVVTDHAVN